MAPAVCVLEVRNLFTSLSRAMGDYFHCSYLQSNMREIGWHDVPVQLLPLLRSVNRANSE